MVPILGRTAPAVIDGRPLQTTIFGAVVGATFYSLARPAAESAVHRLGVLEALSSSLQALPVLAVLVIGLMPADPAGIPHLIAP